jgi:enoyl-CoA hydratase
LFDVLLVCSKMMMLRRTTPMLARSSRSLSTALKESYEYVLAEKRGKVGLITLNRPKALNALCQGLSEDLVHAARAFDNDDEIGAIVVTGSDKAFAAGADIKEMQSKTYVEVYKTNMFKSWKDITHVSKPVIAAVSGYALGGGCELAMMCDIIIASESAKFGQPEVTLGVIAGAGGTQRLTRVIGKSKAMEMNLTGNMIDAAQAERDGLVCRVVPNGEVVNAALAMGEKIASFSQPAVAMAKEAVNASYELNMEEGLRFERRLFHSMFSLEDQKEGMSAFIEKRKPQWKNK